MRLLHHIGNYRLLFFARESPSHCTHVLSSSIAPIQRKRLQEWLEISKVLTSSADAQVSKNFLKQEYEKIKRQILAKLQTSDTGSSFDISG